MLTAKLATTHRVTTRAYGLTWYGCVWAGRRLTSYCASWCTCFRSRWLAQDGVKHGFSFTQRDTVRGRKGKWHCHPLQYPSHVLMNRPVLWQTVPDVFLCCLFFFFLNTAGSVWSLAAHILWRGRRPVELHPALMTSPGTSRLLSNRLIFRSRLAVWVFRRVKLSLSRP